MILYFVDNFLEIVYQKRIINIELKDIIKKGRIIDKEKFINSFINILKKEKIKNHLFGDNIEIISEPFFIYQDYYFLDNLFLELGFIKVSYLPINKLFNLKNITFVEVNNEYMVIHFNEGIYIDLSNFKEITNILSYFKKQIGNFILFGKNKDIPLICHKLPNCYYVDDYPNYISKNLLKAKKSGE